MQTAHSSVALIADSVLGASDRIDTKLDLFPYSSTKLQKNSGNRNHSQTALRWALLVSKVFPKVQATHRSYATRNTSESIPQRESCRSAAYYKSQWVTAVRIRASSMSRNTRISLWESPKYCWPAVSSLVCVYGQIALANSKLCSVVTFPAYLCQRWKTR
jgi:hypothetical protein